MKTLLVYTSLHTTYTYHRRSDDFRGGWGPVFRRVTGHQVQDVAEGNFETEHCGRFVFSPANVPLPSSVPE